MSEASHILDDILTDAKDCIGEIADLNEKLQAAEARLKVLQAQARTALDAELTPFPTAKEPKAAKVPGAKRGRPKKAAQQHNVGPTANAVQVIYDEAMARS
jgi:hypothetical protein